MKGPVGGPDAAAVQVESRGGIPSACLFFTPQWIVLRRERRLQYPTITRLILFMKRIKNHILFVK